MSVTVEVKGLKELEKNLNKLEEKAARRVLLRTLKKSCQPMADLMTHYAPDDPATGNEDLTDGISVSTRLTARARRGLNRYYRATGYKNAAQVFIGPDERNFYGMFQEFGTVKHAPQPFMRPAWDQDKMALLERIRRQLKVEIDAAVSRMQ